MDDVCVYRLSSALDVPSQTAVSTHVIHRFRSTALRTPATQGTHMSPMIYRLILRLTAPEEFEDKPADDETE